MGPSRAADVLLRLSTACRHAPMTRTTLPITNICSRYRTFANTPRAREEQRQSRPQTSSITDDISNLLDTTLDLNKGTPAVTSKRTSRFKSRDAQQSTGRTGAPNELERTRSSNSSSVESLLESMVVGRAPQHRRRPGPHTSADVYNAFGGSNAMPEVTKESDPVILPPNVGRLVEVRDMDVGRAFRRMETLCAKNRVKRSFAQQRFHERPGLKRKRLKNERWIRRFRANFKATVKMVQKMKKQGW